MKTDTDQPPASLPPEDGGDLATILASAGKRKAGGAWRWALLALAVIIAAALGYGYYASRGTAFTYTTATVKKGDLTVLVTATGSVEPTVQVDVSSEQSGTVREVLADYNSIVKKGDVVARLDTEKLQATLKSTEAKLLSAKASVAKTDADMKAAKATLERLRSLVSNRVSTQQELDAAQYSHDAAVATKDSALAEVLSAEADLQTAKLNLSKATIISPIDGIVLSRDVDPGATVAASLEAPTLFKIAGDLKLMELQVAIDEADVGKVEVGQEATFTVDAFPSVRFPAKITQIRYASATVNDVVTYLGILAVANDKMLLRQGMTATADIVVQAIRDTLLIPNAALRYAPPVAARSSSRGFSLFRPPRMGSLTAPEPSGNVRTVWVLRSGAPVAVNVEIGASDGQNTVMAKGEIVEGDALITDSTAKSN